MNVNGARDTAGRYYHSDDWIGRLLVVDNGEEAGHIISYNSS